MIGLLDYSIAICTRNRASVLAECLSAVLTVVGSVEAQGQVSVVRGRAGLECGQESRGVGVPPPFFSSDRRGLDSLAHRT